MPGAAFARRDAGDSARSVRADLVRLLSDDPAAGPPDLPGQLDRLVAGVRAAGVSFELRADGIAGMSGEAAAAAYRVVQEALTNAVRHAGATSVAVCVRFSGDRIEVTVENASDSSATTYDLDEYVYRALKAGASGFLLKDAPADRLTDAVHAAVRGETIFAPEVTRRLVETYIRARPRPAPPRGAQDLTRRESDVWRLLAQGMSNAEIARTPGVGDATAKTHVARILTKLGVRDRVQAVVLAYETGIITPGTPAT